MNSYPIYLLHPGKRWTVVFPKNKEDIGHCDFWEETVSHLIADFFKVPQRKLINLPYCQRRARICGDIVYYGEKPWQTLLASIKKAVGNDNLVFVYDEHERRLEADVREFKRLLK